MYVLLTLKPNGALNKYLKVVEQLAEKVIDVISQYLMYEFMESLRTIKLD